ncbi:MAG TPA: NADH:flavin oxidoreductase/NADH oxidase [Candidatus Acidoferrales bacterium]|nr:NADH:flavin oxidoreductase/NADH oxidase [Candidatus Acidoferrales bacterium]
MHLFDELKIRNVTLRSRIVVSPMCQYSSTDGFASDWHLVHLGSRAVGGAALVFTEASAVLPEARISPQDLGIWKNEHIEMLARITRFIAGQGAIPGIQLAHAGRKASTYRPWEKPGSVPETNGGWKTLAPSAIPFGEGYATPTALDEAGIQAIVNAFAGAARRACEAGFQVVEIHAAHGYLLHQFLSPLSNQRTDAYGGSFENRTRLVREVISAVRKAWPESNPLWIRISATDWLEGGWDLSQSMELAKQLGPLGVDLVDCSSGGLAPGAKIPIREGYQVPFSEAIRRATGVLTGAVGMITTAEHAEAILQEGKADVVLMARQFLRQPYWPLDAARALGVPFPWPVQYLRAAPDGTPTREPASLSELKHCMSDHHAISES